MNEEKYRIGLAGEYQVASMLLRLGYNTSITLGNMKATDIVVLGESNRYLKVEVKTSRDPKKFLTGFFQKYSEPSKLHPDVWVLHLPREYSDVCSDVFYVLKHEDVRRLQLEVNNGHQPKKGKGCDQITVQLLEEKGANYRDNWDIIKEILESWQKESHV